MRSDLNIYRRRCSPRWWNGSRESTGRSVVHGRIGVGECLAVLSVQRRSRPRMTVGEL